MPSPAKRCHSSSGTRRTRSCSTLRSTPFTRRCTPATIGSTGSHRSRTSRDGSMPRCSPRSTKAVGKVLDALRTAGLERDTLIVFLSDNGGPTMPGTTINASRNDPLRGSKRTTLEGGIRVPFVVSWKGSLPEGAVYEQPVIQLDVLPTVLAAAGVKTEPEWKLDGVNLLPYVKGEIIRHAARRALLAAGRADGRSSRGLEARARTTGPPTWRMARSDAQIRGEGDAAAALQPGSRLGREGRSGDRAA